MFRGSSLDTQLHAMGSKFQACVDFFQSVAGDKACCVCYWAYLKGFLDHESQHSLYAVAGDCRCDWSSSSSSSSEWPASSTQSSAGSTSSDGLLEEPESA